MRTSGIIKLALSFFIPFVVGLIVFPMFFGLELTQNSVMFIAIYAFIIFVVVGVYRKEGHQGQIPIWIGITVMFGSFLAIAGSIGIMGIPKQFELSSTSQGFALIGFAIGFLFLMSGLKSMGSAGYFLGNIKGRG